MNKAEIFLDRNALAYYSSEKFYKFFPVIFSNSIFPFFSIS